MGWKEEERCERYDDLELVISVDCLLEMQRKKVVGKGS